NGGRPVEAVVAEAVRGGVSMVQLRDPDAPTRSLVELARALAAQLRPLAIPFIVNDRVDVALASNADGVHVGQKDMDARDVRAMVGEDRIVGLSVADSEELEASRAALGAVDYLGVGPVYATATKADAGNAIGLAGIEWMRRATGLPLVAIGGIDAARTEAILRAGADGVAVVSAIMNAPDPAGASAEILAAARRGARERD
ncbi:MAG: thiamine phosphate synthase, partial [Pseudomonadota bacterium]|nr:thiamine phosphate synthase [Pseudomonadota bacterium]